MSEELKLLPCPICGKPAVATTDHMLMEMVYCCGIADESVSAWNALPRALTWTTEPPKVDGNYWWKCEDESMNESFVVSVTMYSDGKYSHHFHYGNGPCFHECDKCRWAGPIPSPKEPTP